MEQSDKYSYCHIVERTDVGCKRPANEDHMGHFDTVNGRVAVVCDGMGGHVGGATASHIAVEAIHAFLDSAFIESPYEAIGCAIDEANAAILRHAAEARWLAANLEVNYQVLYTGIALNDTHVSSESDLIACTIYKVSTDEKIDIAIIQTNNKVTPSEVDRLVDLNDIATMDELKPGKRIYTIGFPQAFLLGGTEVGLEANNQSGEVTQERGEYQYGHNITIHQGASGSPVFDDRGRFAGVIVSGYLGLSQGYNQAVQPQKAVSLLK